MSEPAIYLDNAATTPVAELVRIAMAPFLAGSYGNPSTRYAAGVRASEALGEARRLVQRALGAQKHKVVFCGSGTEANNLAVLGAARARKAGAIWIGATEHASVRRSAEAWQAEGGGPCRILPLDGQGGLDVARALEQIDAQTAVVSVMAVNNEIGTCYDVARLFAGVGRIAPGAHKHVDCIQALGKLDLDLEDLGADSLSISAHKVHGPKGAGALVVRSEARLQPLIFGGSQEGGWRAGTENMACIAGLARAVELAVAHQDEFQRSAAACRAALETGIEGLAGLHVRRTGRAVDAILSLQVPGAPGEVWQHHIEAMGFEVGVGSACQARTAEISPALKALGLADHEARQVLRVSFSRETKPAEVEGLARALRTLHPRLSEVRP
ncbi:MAG: cysteine desulfurase family protein [Planctomycetota bacterium]